MRAYDRVETEPGLDNFVNDAEGKIYMPPTSHCNALSGPHLSCPVSPCPVSLCPVSCCLCHLAFSYATLPCAALPCPAPMLILPCLALPSSCPRPDTHTPHNLCLLILLMPSAGCVLTNQTQRDKTCLARTWLIMSWKTFNIYGHYH